MLCVKKVSAIMLNGLSILSEFKGINMSFIKNIIIGRPNGFRRGILKSVFGPLMGSSEPDTGPDSAYASPSYGGGGVAVGGAQKMEPPKDVTPPEGFEVVLHKDALKSGEMAEINIAGKMVLLINVDDQFYAVNSSCPHAQGPLADGELSSGILRCPFHGWAFDVTDGSCKTHSEACLDTYDTVVESDAVCVKV